MTKKQLSENVSKWNNEICMQYERQSEIYRELQEMNYHYGDGVKYCTLTDLVRNISTSYYKDKALDLFSEYYSIEGQFKALRRFLKATNNFGHEEV